MFEDTRECRLGRNSLAKDADTTLKLIAKDDKETCQLRTPSRIHSDVGFTGLRFKRSSDNQKLIQDLDSGGVKSKDTARDMESGGAKSKNTTQDDSPIALRTRSRDQLQHPTVDMKQEVLMQNRQIEDGLKELHNQLIIQSKKQQDEIKELKLALAAVLEMQKNYQEKFDNIPIQSSISDQSDNQFMSRGQRNVNANDDASNGHFDTNSLASQPKQQGASDYSGKDSDFGSGVYTKVACKPEDTIKGINKMLSTGSSDDITYAKAFKANPKKNKSEDTTKSLDHSESCESSSIEDSRESYRPSPTKKGGYIVPKEPKKIRDEAQARLDDALDQVPDAVHFDRKGQRTTKTLYVGNLNYDSNAEPLHKALRKALLTDFRNRIRLDKADVPENNGKSRGYGFVTLSWAKAADVKPSDICKIYSGMIDANSRYIYLQQLRKDDPRALKASINKMLKENIALKNQLRREQAKKVQPAQQPSPPPVRESSFMLFLSNGAPDPDCF